MNKEQKEKAIKRTKKWRKNKKNLKELRHEEYIRNKNTYRKSQLKYYKKNKERLKKKSNEYYHKNKKKILKKMKRYNKKYREEHLKQYAYYTRLRTYRVKGASGTHTLEEWNKIKELYNYTCPCCKKSEPEIKLTVDHIVPLSMGGTNYIWNIQPLCSSCNSSKKTKTIHYNIS